jgi:16S rRNA processing protein RimM
MQDDRRQPPPTEAPQDLLLVGRIARAHGNRGQVIVNPETDFAEQRFQPGRQVLVGQEGGALTPRTIASVRFHLGRPILGLEGIETMNDAEAMAGTPLWLAAAAVEPLPEGTFYRHDLRGCEVRTVGGEVIGSVVDVGGVLERSWLVIAGRRGEVLIPLTEEICTRVDPAARVIEVAPPEGLLELNERS